MRIKKNCVVFKRTKKTTGEVDYIQLSKNYLAKGRNPAVDKFSDVYKFELVKNTKELVEKLKEETPAPTPNAVVEPKKGRKKKADEANEADEADGGAE